MDYMKSYYISRMKVLSHWHDLGSAEDSEYQQVQFTWPGQRRNFQAVLNT